MQKLKARADVPRTDRVGPRRNPGPYFFDSFTGKRLRDFHGTRGNKSGGSGGSRCRRSCHSKNGDRAGRCSASSARPKTFSDATFAAISTHGISFGLRTTRANCRTPRAIKLNSADRSSACVLGACELGRCNVSSHRTDAWRRCADETCNTTAPDHQPDMDRRLLLIKPRRDCAPCPTSPSTK